MKWIIALLGSMLVAGPLQAGNVATDNLKVYQHSVVYGKLVAFGGTAAVPTNNLALYYSFDTNTTPLPDDSGNGITGSVFGATWVTNGIRGGAYLFDGVNDYLTTAILDMPTGFTWSVWVKHTQAATSFRQILGLNAGNDMNSYTSLRNDGPSNSYKYKCWLQQGGDSDSVLSSTIPTTNAWCLVTAVKDGATLSLYVNGVLESSGESSCTIGTGYGFIVGANSNGPQRYFPGYIDELRIYTRALSAREVLGLYFNECPVRTNAVNFTTGVDYAAPLGELGMGSFTNNP